MAPAEAWHQSIHLVAMQHRNRDLLDSESLQMRGTGASGQGTALSPNRREDIFNIVTISE